MKARGVKKKWLVTALLAMAIAGPYGGACETAAPVSKSRGHVEIVVFAAASLREVFGEITKAFESDDPEVHVALQLAGSQELRTQIENGAEADVFASADRKHMVALHEAKLVGEAKTFARNEPVVIVPAANPAGLARFEDLVKAERIVVGTPEVPIGNYTNQILANAATRLGESFVKAVEMSIASRELNVRQILAKVSLGEADAGFVYRTDALEGGDRVHTIEIPPDLNVIAEYPIAPLARSRHAALARRWIDLVLSERGRVILTRAGFRTP